MRKEYQFNPIQFEEGAVLQRKMIKRACTDPIAMNRNDPYQRLNGLLEILRPRVTYIHHDAMSPKNYRSSMNTLETADRSNRRLNPANLKLLRIYKYLKV